MYDPFVKYASSGLSTVKLVVFNAVLLSIGVPTEDGLKLSAQITYKANRQAVIDIATQMQAEEDAAKK